VAVVPAEGHAASECQDAVELRERGVEVEPVERRTSDDRGSLAVAERYLLRRALHPFEAEPAEYREHPWVRLDRDDPHAERRQRPRQLSGAGSELDDELRVLGDEPARRLLRPLRPRALVGVGMCSER